MTKKIRAPEEGAVQRKATEETDVEGHGVKIRGPEGAVQRREPEGAVQRRAPEDDVEGHSIQKR